MLSSNHVFWIIRVLNMGGFMVNFLYQLRIKNFKMAGEKDEKN